MSHDPQSPTDAADFDDDDFDALCEQCGAGLDMVDVNAEAFEVTGMLLCSACAVEALDDQPDPDRLRDDRDERRRLDREP